MHKAVINLRDKKLKEIPIEIFNQVNLRKLYLSNNNISSIPSDIQKLKNLELLDLSNNNIQNLFVSICKLKRLKILILNNNKLTSLPKQIGNLKKLTILGVGTNQLCKLPSEFSNLEGLRELNISKNKFSDFPEEILTLKKLRKLWLQNNIFIDFPKEKIKSALIDLKCLYCFSNILGNSDLINSDYLSFSRIKGNSINHLNELQSVIGTNDYSQTEPDNKITKNNIFISYAREDKNWLIRIKKYLKTLNFSYKNLSVWDDTEIKAGDDWEEKIETALNACQIAILIISNDFLGSDFIRNNELPPLLQNAQTKGTKIIPLIVNHCRFTKDENLSKFQALNDPNEPLCSLSISDQDKWLLYLSNEIEDHIIEHQ